MIWKPGNLWLTTSNNNNYSRGITEYSLLFVEEEDTISWHVSDSRIAEDVFMFNLQSLRKRLQSKSTFTTHRLLW